MISSAVHEEIYPAGAKLERTVTDNFSNSLTTEETSTLIIMKTVFALIVVAGLVTAISAFQKFRVNEPSKYQSEFSCTFSFCMYDVIIDSLIPRPLGKMKEKKKGLRMKQCSSGITVHAHVGLS